MESFWSGFEKRASMLRPNFGVAGGMFSRGGIQQAVKHNPLPSANMKPMGMPKRISGAGAGGMPIP